jgi:hypothetical protein
VRGGVDAAEPLGKLVGALGLGLVGQEAAGLPAQRPVEAHPNFPGRWELSATLRAGAAVR